MVGANSAIKKTVDVRLNLFLMEILVIRIYNFFNYTQVHFSLCFMPSFF